MECSELEEEFDFPIDNKDDAALMLCLALGLSKAGCDNCPVVRFNADFRSQHEKQELHVPCWVNLIKWLKNNDKI